jgi:DNA recombination protein RmuC
MNPEILLAVLITIIIVSIVFIIILVRLFSSSRRRQEELPLSYKELGGFDRTLQNVQRLGQDLKNVVQNIENRLEERKRADEKNEEVIRRLDHIIAGTKTRGIAGENIIDEVFKQFPAEMVVRNYRIKNREVEFGIVLSDGKIIPVDSKWTSSEDLKMLADEEDVKRRLQLINSVKKVIKSKIQEVSSYVDPEATAPLAVCAVPDAVYSVSHDLHPYAYKNNVILISYSLLLPYLLTLYHMHLQYSRDYDIENLQHYLLDVKHKTDNLTETLENKLIKSSVMLGNAIDEIRQIINSIKNSLLKITEH